MVVGRPKLKEQLCREGLRLGYPILLEDIFYVVRQLKKKKKTITGGSGSNSLLTSSGHNFYLF